MPRGSLVVVGTGIKAVAHASLEGVEHIKRADLLLHLASEPVSRRWLSELNPRSRSLHDHLARFARRDEAYAAMVDEVMAEVEADKRVCFALYGHPGVFATPGHAAVRRARAIGFDAMLLPAISASDCLFADLGFDPAAGCSFHEATDFLVYGRRPDASCALLLWQVGAIGHLTGRPPAGPLPGVSMLTARLAEVYGGAHRVVVYEAAQYASCRPVIDVMPLADLERASLSLYATLFVPPRERPQPDEPAARALGITQPRRSLENWSPG